MQNGLYKVEFQTQRASGAGVVVLEGGKIRGGDSAMYYVGSYKESGTDFSADVEGRKHSSPPGMVSVFGVDHTHITLKGKISGNSATMTGTAKEAPGVAFQAKLSRLAD
jgi:hypothetical protein